MGDTEVPSRGKVELIHPPEYKSPVSAGSGDDMGSGASNIDTGVNVPRKVIKKHIGNVITMELSEEPFPSKLPLEVTISLVNPPISPPPSENVWRLSSYTQKTAEMPWTMLDCNFDVPGFRIYGEFRNAQVASAISSPTVKNIVGIWYVLESDLPDGGLLHIWMPPGFTPLRNCGGPDEYSPSYKHAQFTGPSRFP